MQRRKGVPSWRTYAPTLARSRSSATTQVATMQRRAQDTLSITSEPTLERSRTSATTRVAIKCLPNQDISHHISAPTPARSRTSATIQAASTLLQCMKRMAKVMASLTVEAGEAVPRVAWLRYNPHTWHVDGALQRRVPKASREAWLCAHLATLTLDAVPLAIGYAFYDTSSDGVLDVVLNDEFHPAFAEVTVDLTAEFQ